jgi:crotonobetainyl-CoA:carnitine CoA-transferase CaiB-like acyl-CoA transferase
VIDAALYGSSLRVLEWTLAAYDRLGTVRTREGNRLANSAPLDNYLAADGRYVCIVAAGDAGFRRLCAAMRRPDLLDDARFATLADLGLTDGDLDRLAADGVI